MNLGEQYLINELGSKTIRIANLVKENEDLKKDLETIIALLTTKQKQKLGLVKPDDEQA